MSVLLLGYSAPQKSVLSSVDSSGVTKSALITAAAVDEVMATSIAASAAEVINSPVATNVANLSVSLSAKSELAASVDTSVTKQEIIQPVGSARELQSHLVKDGETIDQLAEKYDVSKDTIKWANNLNSDKISVGKEIIIPPVDGVVYTVKENDTVEKIASKYGADTERIIAFNDLELSDLQQERDRKIIIPDGVLPENERPGYQAPVAAQSNSGTSSNRLGSSGGSYMAGSVGNKYAYGYCTWYAYERRAAMGRPIGSFWGNANTWTAAARSQGFVVSNIPVAGAVFWTSAGYYGHVGIIESVDTAGGTVTYSDMNGKGGWGRTYTETISLSQAQSQWMFIY